MTRIACFNRAKYDARMVTRIGPRSGKPHRIYFKEWREKRELTQEQVADRIGTTKATVSRMEAGKVQYNRGYLDALAYALSVEPMDLFRDPDRPSADALLQNADPETRQRAISVLEALLKAG